MAKKKIQNRRSNSEAEAQVKADVRADVRTQVETEGGQEKPSFEIGVKGDEFERRYRRAAMSLSAPADRLLNSLSRESSADKYNFLGFAIPAILILIIALSLTIISRGDIEEQLNVQPSLKTVMNGEYFKNLNDVYEQTVTFKDGAMKLCAAMGLCEAPVEPAEELVPDEEPAPPEPLVTSEPAVTQQTEPAVTTAPPETDPPVTVQTEETEPESYETFIMYATATVNIRLGPSTDDAILGNYVQNEEAEVIAIREDGWAEVLFDGIKAYAYAEYLSDSKVEETTTRRRSRTDATTAEPEDTTFDEDENGEVTFVPDDDSGEPTSVPENGGEQDSGDESADSSDESVTLDDEPYADGGQSDGNETPSDGENSSYENGEPW